MDPVTLATITSAITVVASECAKNTAGEAGKDLWAKIKSILKWNAEPTHSDLSTKIAEELQRNPQIAAQIVELLKNNAQSVSAGTLVSKVDAKKVVIAQIIDVHGNFNM